MVCNMRVEFRRLGPSKLKYSESAFLSVFRLASFQRPDVSVGLVGRPPSLAQVRMTLRNSLIVQESCYIIWNGFEIGLLESAQTVGGIFYSRWHFVMGYDLRHCECHSLLNR